jgi:glycosyltransferase involved in cell wall biosynthesis
VTRLNRDDLELIVVDDGSTDARTRDEMDKLCLRGIKVIRQTNQGLAGARNAGVRNSTGKYLLPLDADNRLRAAYLEKGALILDAHPEIGVVYGDAEYIGTRSGRSVVGSFDPGKLLNWNFIDACALYRRPVWEQNQGYDGTMPVQGLEDWDFWLGALGQGWQFAYLPEVAFDYRMAGESMLTRVKGAEDKIAEFVARKHGPLYREAWLRLRRERSSVKATLRNLVRLCRERVPGPNPRRRP